MMRILQERDNLNEVYWSQTKFSGSSKALDVTTERGDNLKDDRRTILQSVNTRSP